MMRYNDMPSLKSVSSTKQFVQFVRSQTIKKDYLWALLKLSALLLVTAAFIQSLNRQLVLDRIKNIGCEYLFCAIGLQLLMRLLSAWQLQGIVIAQNVTRLSKLYAINLSAAFYGIVLPGEMASAGITWHKLRNLSNDGKQAFAALMLSGAVNLSVLVVLGGVFWIIQSDLTRFAILVILSGTVTLLVLAYRLQPVWNRIYRGISNNYPLITQYGSALSKINTTLSTNKLVKSIAISLAVHTVGITSHFVFANAVGLIFTIWTIGWIRSACLLAGLLPFSLGGFGIRELSLVYLLRAYGATPEQAVVYSMLTVLTVFAVGILGAGLEFVTMTRTMLKTFSDRNRRA